MLKGHATIELTDVETGEKQVIDHDNLVTKGLEHFLQHKFLGVKNILLCDEINVNYIGYTFKSSRNLEFSIRKKLFNGLFLFEDTQEENENNYIINTANRIIGKGGTTAYTGGDTLRGSFSAVDSGEQEDGSMKYVWDFNPSQANGKISSLSLVPNLFSTLGYGTKIKDGPEEMKSIFSYSNGRKNENYGFVSKYPKICINKMQDYEKQGYHHYGFAFVNPESNIMGVFQRPNTYYYRGYEQYFFTNTGKLILKILKVPFASMGYFNDIAYMEYKGEEVEIAIPESFLDGLKDNSTYCSWQYDNGFIYFQANSKEKALLNNDDFFEVLRIDTRNKYAVDVLKIVNKTGEQIHLSGTGTESGRINVPSSNSANGGGTCIHKNYAVLCGYSGKRYRINLNDNTDIRVITMDNEPYVSKKTCALLRIEGLLFCHGDCIINIDTCEALYCGTDSFYESYMYGNTYPYIYEKGMIYFIFSSLFDNDRYYDIGCAYSPYVLMTINNLPSPVTKTASQSMRVTYTISQAPDEPTT